MVPHIFRALRNATGPAEPMEFSGPGTQVTAQAHVASLGLVTATVQLQGSNTPSLASSWVTLDTLDLSGSDSAVDSGTVATSFIAFRFNVTSMSAGAQLMLSLARG